MGEYKSFVFKANKMTTMRVNLSATDVVVTTEGGKNAHFEKTRSIDFADVRKVRLSAFERKKTKTGSLTFHPAQGEAVALVGSSGGPIGAGETDLNDYYVAAEAVLAAYARARPDAEVLLGRSPASQIGDYLAMVIAGALAAYLASGGDSFAFGAGVAGVIVVAAITGYSQMGIGRRSHLVPVSGAILRIVDRSVARPTAT